MANQYYYFISTLPILEFEGKMSFSIENFLIDCQRLLTEADYRIVKQVFQSSYVSDETARNNSFFQYWLSFEIGIKNELAALRADEAGKDPLDYLRGFKLSDPTVISVVNKAVKEAENNPLNAEKLLDRLRWQFLDDVLVGISFQLENIIAYAIKLKILNRYNLINSDRGREKFETVKSLSMIDKEKLNFGF